MFSARKHAWTSNIGQVCEEERQHPVQDSSDTKVIIKENEHLNLEPRLQNSRFFLKTSLVG